MFIAVQIGTYQAVFNATTDNIKQQIDERLIYSTDVVNRSLNQMVEDQLTSIHLLSSDFGFRSAVATQDGATIMTALENLRARMNADGAVLISLDYDIIAETDAFSTEQAARPFSHPELIDKAYDEGQASAFIRVDDGIYNMVVAPVLAPIPVAWVGIRVGIYDQRAQDIKALLPAGLDLSFMAHTGEQFNLTASTLPEVKRHALETMIDQSVALSLNAFQMNGEDYLGHFLELPSSDTNEEHIALVHYSLDVAYAPYKALIFTLAILLSAGLILLIIGSMAIARGVTKPISRLSDAALKAQEGHYQPVDNDGHKDEVFHLANSFNKMVQGIEQREMRIRHQAEHDLETGIPNAIRFENHVNTLLSAITGDGHKLSLIEVTIERFSVIRNTIGYASLKELTNQIAPRLRQALREEDMIARISTETFIIALDGHDSDQALKVAQNILKTLESPFQANEYIVDLHARIGLATFPDHGDTVEKLIQRTNIAGIQALDRVDHIAVYDAALDRHDKDLLSLMGELQKAISANDGSLRFNYQPKINVKTGKIGEVEALVRWTHPERGFIPPDNFIPMAEATGFVFHLTKWALYEGVAQLGKWRRDGIDIRLAVNLSARDLISPELVPMIDALLREHEVAPCNLVVEVTESAVMTDTAKALETLNNISAMGVVLSLDDYGTGYSSLSYLKQLPIDELKIDKSFVLKLASNKEDEILVRSTIKLGHSLGLKVTAEGVEDEASVAIIKDLECDMVQGYYYSKPLPIDELEKFIKHSPYGLG